MLPKSTMKRFAVSGERGGRVFIPAPTPINPCALKGLNSRNSTLLLVVDVCYIQSCEWKELGAQHHYNARNDPWVENRIVKCKD